MANHLHGRWNVKNIMCPPSIPRKGVAMTPFLYFRSWKHEDNKTYKIILGMELGAKTDNKDFKHSHHCGHSYNIQSSNHYWPVIEIFFITAG
jgi:hypothetical protein